MNIFDIIIIVIVAIAMLAGFAKGFFKSVASLLGWLAAIVMAILFAKTVASGLSSIGFVSKYFFHNPDGGFSFANWIYKILPSSLRIEMDTVRNWIIVDGAVIENASEIIVDHVKEKNSIVGIIMSLFEASYVETIVDASFLSYNFADLSQAISLLLANSILVFFSGLVLLIIFKIIANIIIKIIQKAVVSEKQGINVFSRLLGMILGGLKGVLICAVLLATMSYVINFPFLSSVKKELFDNPSMISADFAEYSFDSANRLLKTNDTEKLLKNSGFEATIDLSQYPIVIEEPEEPEQPENPEEPEQPEE